MTESGADDSPDNGIDSVEVQRRKQCCDLYDGNADATGWSWLAAGRGCLVMSNTFLTQSLLWLASDAAGCVVDGEIQECKEKIYGFLPASLITNIATIAGVLSALMMPVCGAFVDLTPYRRMIGVIIVIIITGTQALQIYTVESTWFFMAMLQSVAVMFYQMQVVVVYAYLPDIARDVGEVKMTQFSSKFTSTQFLSQVLFLVLITVISIGLGTSPVHTAQISQGINTLTSIVLFGVGWFKYMTPRPALRELPEGHSLITEGFKRNWRTAKTIWKHYKNGLRWFFCALTFAEAAASAAYAVAIVYLTDSLQYDSTQVGIFFLIALVGTLPGAAFAGIISKRTNPNTSWKLSLVTLFTVFTIGPLVLEDLPTYWSYVWAIFVGFGFGWFYPTENLFFSMCLPKGQEAELGGFFVFATQIIAWLPPIIFTVTIEANVAIKYGVLATAAFFLVAVALLMFTCSWEGIIEESKSEAAAVASELHEGDVQEAGEKLTEEA